MYNYCNYLTEEQLITIGSFIFGFNAMPILENKTASSNINNNFSGCSYSAYLDNNCSGCSYQLKLK